MSISLSKAGERLAESCLVADQLVAVRGDDRPLVLILIVE